VRKFAVVAVLVILPATATATATAATPKPKTGKTVVVKRTSGTVKVKLKGKKSFTKLTKATAIPVGSTVDTTRGRVKLTSTHNRSGSKLQSGSFYDGMFVVTQDNSSSPTTDLELAGSDFSDCDAALRSSDARAARRIKRKLWGDGKGRFRTRGRNGTATVRGTKWVTEDSCTGTAEETARGMVEAAPNDGAIYDVATGERITFYCAENGFAPVSSLYCLVVDENPKESLYAFGIASLDTPDTSYDLCFNQPNGVQDCETLPFDTTTPNEPAGGFACFPDMAGTYTVQWRIRGIFIPVPFTYDVPTANPQKICASAPPRPEDMARPALVRAARGQL
jgi:hypothetical protein